MRNVASLGKLIVCAANATVPMTIPASAQPLPPTSPPQIAPLRASPRGQPDDDGWDGGIRRPVEDHRGENRGRACTAQ